MLLLAEQHLRYLLPANIVKSLDSFFKTARSQLSPIGQDTKKQKEGLDKVLIISDSQPLIPPKIDSDVMEAVSTALYENRWLSVTYRNASGTTTSGFWRCIVSVRRRFRHSPSRGRPFDLAKECAYYILESPLSEDQACEEHEAHYVFTATIVDSGRLQRWLNSFGGDVRNVTKEPVGKTPD